MVFFWSVHISAPFYHDIILTIYSKLICHSAACFFVGWRRIVFANHPSIPFWYPTLFKIPVWPLVLGYSSIIWPWGKKSYPVSLNSILRGFNLPVLRCYICTFIGSSWTMFEDIALLDIRRIKSALPHIQIRACLLLYYFPRRGHLIGEVIHSQPVSAFTVIDILGPYIQVSFVGQARSIFSVHSRPTLI